MRFSVAFEHLAALRHQSTASEPGEVGHAEPGHPPSRPATQPTGKPRQDLPVDLDQRVRLIGEW